ncbi:BLUF domain-containing protein [Chitinilyticum piscinae]|uniref:BLUF domain-containing protein n=1 Tax=Chitinilyticum piscinae TaxID=2866724 RepID=A0A8J7FJE3_9NEIS|nr:BLUF domain-containing protein [Chitinilyticum piscinae]MBE9607919.1 BLUF domain-containing protein [Chitinilyticum piscinae]
MYLVRLIYVSQLSEQFRPGDVEHILQSARSKNSALHVTGALFFNPAFFLQCLEGSREAVNQTYQQILKDPRHNHILQLQYQEIARRDFSEWSMGYVPDSARLAPVIKAYSRSDMLDPYTMSGESCYQLLLALKGLMA